LAPAVEVTRVERHYRGSSLVLETLFHTAEGSVAVIDCMPIRGDHRLDLVRLVEGRSGHVPMRMHLTARMDYGSIVPWVRRVDGGLRMVAGPDALGLTTPVELRPDGWSTVAEFTVGPGDRVPFDLAWHASHQPFQDGVDVAQAIDETEAWWQAWHAKCKRFGEWDEAIQRSLVVLKGLTYAPTGGIVAAATTSLPEAIGGPRNWDYRYCWLRDATFTLMSLMQAGYEEEATAWRDWLMRAVAGRPDEVQIMYGPTGEHRLTELELDWLPGYEGSTPVRVGNAAHGQFQLDVFGEVLDALHQARALDRGRNALYHWRLESNLVEVVAKCWSQPDDGLWEVRGGRRHFTHSKVMAWVAVDRAIRSAVDEGLDAPLDRWKALRDEIRAEVLAKGLDDKGRFVQSYGSTALDASLLMVPLVGFLPADDPRVVATVKGIQDELTDQGFVRRYDPSEADDGLAGSEGTFLMCTFWMADVLAMQGRTHEAREIFERLLALRNDVGLLAEQYDPTTKRMLGNFPQAFSHTALVQTAIALAQEDGKAPRAQRPQ
ncbi:MAG TPA: glycoside hydrolase family 15 protein, partial [Acidimicrobiales bacterium]